MSCRVPFLLIVHLAAALPVVGQDGLAGWSYASLEPVQPPTVSDESWVTSDLDRFVLRRLEDAGLRPAPPADRVALVRRALFDLIGLPPSPEEVQAFLDDDRPDAFPRLVDDLLSRPQYGEKWARHWLDLVRYAETNGYERDSNKKFAWRYRDWVIDAFNSDKPYDRMILEQLAGDELDDRTPETTIATGYLRLMQWDDEPGQGRLQARYDVLDDVVSTTSEALLGMTVGCARCHDHKGDPISQREYYGFMSWFVGMTDMSIDGVLTSIASPEEEQRRVDAEKKKREDEARVIDRMRSMEGEYLSRLNSEAVGAGALVGLRYRFYRDTWDRMPDFDMLLPEAKGELPSGLLDLTVASRNESVGLVYEGNLTVPRPGSYTFNFRTRLHPRLVIAGQEVIGAGSKKKKGLWSATVELAKGLVPFRFDYWVREKGHGLDAWWTEATPALWRFTTEEPGEGWQSGPLGEGWDAGSPGFGTEGTPGARVGTEWSSGRIWLRTTFDWGDQRPADAVLVVHHDEDVEVWINGTPAFKRGGYRGDYEVVEVSPEARATLRPEGNVLAVHCRQTGGGQYVHVAPLSRSELGRGELADLAFGRRSLSLRRAPKERRKLQDEVMKRGREVLGEEAFGRYEALRKELDKVRRRRLPEIDRAMAVQERGPKPPKMHVHVRGNAHVKGAEVEPLVPACVSAPPPSPAKAREERRSSGRRRALAEWIVNPANPLTSRVMANRVFQHHFGRGIVETSSDFGELGSRPTHPRLLDWLANKLVAGGWSIKKLHRTIMLSSTYRMSGREDARALQEDPSNRLFWRFDGRRMTAEEIRDSMLAVSGQLNLKAGGPSFYSLMPKAALATSSRPGSVWGMSSDEESRRRSIYIKVKRSLLTPILSSFDLADTDKACPVRFNTTTPIQALSALNGAFTQRMADAFARRLTAECGEDDRARVRLGVVLVSGREADAEQLEDHVAFLAELREEYKLSDHDALQKFCLVCLNSNGFLYID